jgi:geranylgeranyl diphosphate synthase type I
VNDVQSRLAAYAAAVDTAMKQLLASQTSYDGLYAMLGYHLGWLDRSMTPVDGASGKKLRPGLCLLIAESLGGDWRPAVPAAAALELVHNFSLIHDDIQDQSPLRRYRETVWAVWGEAQAINAGDAMLIVAEQALLERPGSLPPEIVVGALARLNRTCRALCEGQFLDMRWEHEASITVEQYVTMIERKTARLFECSAELGAFVVGASEAAQRQCAAYGSALGMAFQVADDLLGVWGPEAETGKTADLDIANRKKSLPVVLGLSAEAPSPERDLLRELFSLDRRLTPEETAEATRALEGLGVREETTAIARRFRAQALGELDHPSVRSHADLLRAFLATALPIV